MNQYLYTAILYYGKTLKTGEKKLLRSPQSLKAQSDVLTDYRPSQVTLELGRYRYLESVSVFGIFFYFISCRFYIRYRYRLLITIVPGNNVEIDN